MEEGTSLTEIQEQLEYHKKMTSQIKILLECKETIGLNIKEILNRIKDKVKEQSILELEDGWEILEMVNQMDKEFLLVIQENRLQAHGKMEFGFDNIYILNYII